MGQSLTGRQWVESPPHVDERRIRHISALGLAAALGPADDAHPTALGDAAHTGADQATDSARRRLLDWRAQRAAGSAVSARDLTGWARRRAARGVSPDLELVAAADRLLAAGEPDWLDTRRGRSAFYGFHYLTWTRPLLQAHALTGDDRFVLGWLELIRGWDAHRDRVVGGWPGLDVIWYSLGVWSRNRIFVDAVDRLAGCPQVSDRDWQMVTALILGGARWSAEEHRQFRPGNWQLSCVTGLAEVAALFPEWPESQGWDDLAADRIEEHLRLDFYPDGGHIERSPGYHVMVLECLEQVAFGPPSRSRSLLLSHPRVRAGYDWLASMSHHAGWIPPLQDSPVVYPADRLLRGVLLFGDARWKALCERWFSRRVPAELDGVPTLADGSDPVLRYRQVSSAGAGELGSVLLDSSGYAVLRSADGTLTTTINVGPYVDHELESHSHHAALDFVASQVDRPLVWEAGTPQTYDHPDYHRWFQSAGAHSTLVTGATPDSPGRAPAVTLFASNPLVDVVSAEHDAWPGRHGRMYVLVKAEPVYWYVLDEIDVPDPVDWLLHAPTAFRRGTDDKWFCAPAAVTVCPLEPVRGVDLSSGPTILPAVGNAEQQMWQSHWAGDREETTYPTLHTLRLLRRPGRVATIIYPTPTAATAPPIVTPIDQLTARLDLSDGQDVVGPYRWVRRTRSTVAVAGWAPQALDENFCSVDGGPADLRHDGGVSRFWLSAESDAVSGRLVATRRTAVQLTAPVTGAARLAGVVIGQVVAGEPVRFLMPHAGTWDVAIG